jgi:hypothetical protein
VVSYTQLVGIGTMNDQVNRFLLLGLILIFALFHTYLWIRIVQKMGYKGWLSIMLTAIISLFLYLSGYHFIVLLALLAFLAFGKWPILRVAAKNHKTSNSKKKRYSPKSRKKKK